MNITINIPDYDGEALDVIWSDDSKFEIDFNDNATVIAANKSGLISLAKQMLYLAYNDLPRGSHIHYHAFFTKMDPNDIELIIDRRDDL